MPLRQLLLKLLILSLNKFIDCNVLNAIKGLKVFNSKLPSEPAKLIDVLFPITCTHTMLNASICVGLIFPGIIDEPGSFSGKLNSPKPDLGPEANNLISLIILRIDTANVFKLPEKFTMESWAAIASNLFLFGLYLFSVSLFKNLQKIISKFFGAFIPVPTAVPP